MKKYIFIVVLVLSLLFIASCEAGGIGTPSNNNSNNNSTTDQPSEPTQTSVVSVYDDQMNLVNKYSFNNPTDNTIDASAFEKTGYKFEGVFDMNRDIMLFNANGFQAPTVMLDTNYTAVLKYSPITYQLVFEAKEGELQNPSDYIKNISYGETVELFPEPVLEGMTFDGWFDESGTRFSFGASPVYTKFTTAGFTMPEEIIKLHAQYTTKYCNVRLMYQDGTNDIQIKVQYGQKLPDMTEYFKDVGSRVVTGFGVSSNSTVVFDDKVYTDLELYALWKDYKNVSFVYTETETKIVKVYREGSMSNLPDGERSGYVFDGWYSSELLSGNKIVSVPFSSLADTYYAKWSLGNYTIKFVADGILIGSSNFSIENPDILVPPVPTKEHYTAKWEDYKLEFKDIIVNAIYEPEELKITLSTGLEYSYQNITYGEMYELPVPAKKGYEFTGWYYNDEKLTEKDGRSLKPYFYDKAITITAKWVGTKCKLYFESNGGSAVDSVTVDYGTPYTFTQIPERQGYYFGGWFEETMINEYINTITLTKDTIVYAKWIKSTPIYNAEDLNLISENPFGNYHLMANINLKGEEWTPIKEFSGILNGNGYNIYNFSLRQNGVDLAFIITNSGTIKNLTFSNIELSNTIDGNKTCSISAVCAYNTGKLLQVNTEKVSMLVNVTSTNANNTVSLGAIAGENTGTLMACSAHSELVYKEDIRVSTNNGSCTTYIYVGGVVGKDSGVITDVSSDFMIEVNEYVHAFCDATYYANTAIKYAYLHIGGISGAEYGKLTNGTSFFGCLLYSNAGGSNAGYYASYRPARYTYIGGAVGCAYESSTIETVFAKGSMELERVGLLSDSYEFANGGIIGKVDSGSVNNCASNVYIMLKKGFGGTTGGIAGYVALNGKVSNTNYYGDIVTESAINGYFGGLAGRVDGMLTKGYFNGKIFTESQNAADIVGYIETTGSVSKTIGNGNTQKVFAENKGAAKNDYIININYGYEMLFSREILFDELCLFETDVWDINEDTGLYLISFPKQ